MIILVKFEMDLKMYTYKRREILVASIHLAIITKVLEQSIINYIN